MKQSEFKGTPRTIWGKKATRALRKTGQLPVIIYGHGEAPESISLDQHEIELALTGGARTLTVDHSGQTTQYLIKAVQYDYLDSTPIHIDLARVKLDERVTVKINIELRGVPKGISSGGVLDQLLTEIELECLVTEIPEILHPLVSELDLGDSLYVKDLELPEGVKVLTDPEERVATITTIAEEIEDEESTAEGEADATEAEPERIGRVRKDDEEPEKKS